MVAKERLHLGQAVWVGPDKKWGIIDGLSQTFAGVRVMGEGYQFLGYDQIEEVPEQMYEKWADSQKEFAA